MANFWTNRGKYKMCDHLFRGTALPTNWYIILLANDVTPTVDTNTVSDAVEITAGNGYTTGGYSLTKNSTDFPTLTEDDATDVGYTIIKNVVWTASGGSIPTSGNAARWACLTDDNATVADRQIYIVFDLGADKTASVGQTLTLSGMQIQGEAP